MEGTKIVAGELAAAFGGVVTDNFFTVIGLFSQPARIVLAQNLNRRHGLPLFGLST